MAPAAAVRAELRWDVSGALWSGCASGSEPIAMWSAHGTRDSVVGVANGRSARDEFLRRNGCSNTSTPTSPSVCVSYQGCAADAPVVWCEWDGDHIPPSYSPGAIWDFFSQF